MLSEEPRGYYVTLKVRPTTECAKNGRRTFGITLAKEIENESFSRYIVAARDALEREKQLADALRHAKEQGGYFAKPGLCVTIQCFPRLWERGGEWFWTYTNMDGAGWVEEPRG